ncbi:nuclease EXOG, mitochondrial isoform X3 [Labeo rohita]|uniref:nuclease EXOG, mitochondrial isoform X1 n=1 Tax=Labeo rohita TaxID=84645 RepID=UPI0021E233EB|nr:nuclease EXOG, mitochondrial isoform X1 [Labeo rohita]XP_050954588.1 nuclease EXOG, mitochondrial isoform X2 [Labeo rohita]XP_050954589.1 nuclease EXOG, mitochondrial isoform X3 [Labeo rohita]
MAPHVISVRFVSGFVFGAASGVAALKLYLYEEQKTDRGSSIHRLIERFGLPQTGAETRFYLNHVLSYDQARRTPRWVAEHLSAHRLLGQAERKHCKFKPDPSIPELFSAQNEDYLRSGWSRGHMAPAGDNKISEQAMAETFYLSNIVPQNYENNAGFWNRLEMYCRELTQSFADVWVISGPLLLPQTSEDGSRTVSYQLIGKDDVAVPTHLYKIILAQKDSSSDSLALGAFVVPNAPIGFDHQLTEFQVSLSDLERMSGLTFFPAVEQREELKNLCDVDSCQLMDFRRFTLYISGRKVASARTMARLEKIMTELKDAGITPDEYLSSLYLEKKRELAEKEEHEKKPEQ